MFCLVFTTPAKWRVSLRAKIGHYRNTFFDELLLFSGHFNLNINIVSKLQYSLLGLTYAQIVETSFTESAVSFLYFSH